MSALYCHASINDGPMLLEYIKERGIFAKTSCLPKRIVSPWVLTHAKGFTAQNFDGKSRELSSPHPVSLNCGRGAFPIKSPIAATARFYKGTDLVARCGGGHGLRQTRHGGKFLTRYYLSPGSSITQVHACPATQGWANSGRWQACGNTIHVTDRPGMQSPKGKTRKRRCALDMFWYGTARRPPAALEADCGCVSLKTVHSRLFVRSHIFVRHEIKWARCVFRLTLTTTVDETVYLSTVSFLPDCASIPAKINGFESNVTDGQRRLISCADITIMVAT